MEDVADFLLSCDVPPDIIQNFTSNGITKEILYKITPDLMKELCPHIATRIKLSEIITATAGTESFTSEKERFLQETPTSESSQKTDGIPTEPNTSIFLEANEPSQSSHITDFVITRCFPDFDLHTLLQTSAGGNSIIKFYEINSHLNNSKRNELTDLIVKHIYTYIVNHKITYEEYNLLAAKIITVFPTESVGTYFTKPVKKRQSVTGRPLAARGKLVDKVRNLLYRYGERKRPHSQIDKEPEKKTHDNTQESQHVIWLKANREPWDEVINHWKSTFEMRKDANYSNINEFYIHWPILNDLRSDTLISIDFDMRYPNSGLNFYLYWNDFFEKVIQMKNPTNENLLSILQGLEKLDEERKISGQIHVLTHLIPPKGRLNKKVKFSTQEAVDSIFILVANAGDVDRKIEEQKLKASASKLQVQPYIILQGTLHDCSSPLLVIDNIKYSFNSISKAFDTMFKTFHVFDARYPRASNHIHLIIQRCIYKIQTKYDNVVPYIVDILNL